MEYHKEKGKESHPKKHENNMKDLQNCCYCLHFCEPRCIQQRAAASRLGCRLAATTGSRDIIEDFIATRLAAGIRFGFLCISYRLRQLLRVQTPKGFLKKYIY